MKRLLVFAAFLILALSLIPSCSDSGDNGVAPGMRAAGTIQGRILDTATGDPVPGVTVKITSVPFATDTTATGTLVVMTTSGSDGIFTRTDIGNGYVTVQVNKTGYRTPESQSWALTPGGIGDFRFDMAPGQDPVNEFEGDEQNAWPPDHDK
jgi:hypothetical protein